MQYSITHPGNRVYKISSKRKKIECVVMDPPSFDFFQPVLSGGTSSNIKIFEGIPLLSYTMGLCEKIFQFLEAVDQKKPIVLSEGIGI